MFIIDNVRVEERAAQERFACDLVKCKGACCTIPGGRGAPLADAELAEIRRALPAAMKYLPEEHRRAIRESGWFEGEAGNYVTTCVQDRACVFVYYEKDIARCSLERAYLDGETQWRKPLSCHLFPIRISTTVDDLLQFETLRDCKPAHALGQRENIPLYLYLKEPLIRTYGEAWYEKFREECSRRDQIVRFQSLNTGQD